MSARFELRRGKPIWEVFRLPVCKTGVFKQAGSDDWSVTSTSHQPSPAASRRAKAAHRSFSEGGHTSDLP